MKYFFKTLLLLPPSGQNLDLIMALKSRERKMDGWADEWTGWLDCWVDFAESKKISHDKN